MMEVTGREREGETEKCVIGACVIRQTTWAGTRHSGYGRREPEACEIEAWVIRQTESAGTCD